MSELINEYINTVISYMRDNFETIYDPELEVSDRDEFLDLLKLNIYDKSIDNFMEYHSPVLTEEQFNECWLLSVTEINLQKLIGRGLVESKFDLESGKMVYKLTDEGISAANHVR